MRLTDTKLREATLADGRRYRVLGDGRGGYGLRLVIQRGKSGNITKSFVQRLTIDGKQTDIGIGGYPLLTLDDARAIALDNARRMRVSRVGSIPSIAKSITPTPIAATPITPIVETPIIEDVPTFGDAYERNIQLRQEQWQTNTRGRSSSELQWRGKYKNYLADTIGDMPINAITSRTMQEILEPLWTSKPSVANDIISYSSIVFEWAIGMEYIATNPVGKARKALGGRAARREKQSQKALSHAKIADWYSAIERVSGMDIAKNALRFLILTATRKEEVLGAKWQEIDFANKTWTIPADRMKASQEHVVPLSSAAVNVLIASMRDTHKPDAYIFSTERQGGEYGKKMIASGTLNGMVKRVNAATGEAAVPHGMRTTFRTWVAECTDTDREIAELCLSHDDASKVEKAYRRTDYLEKRRPIMQSWADYINMTKA